MNSRTLQPGLGPVIVMLLLCAGPWGCSGCWIEGCSAVDEGSLSSTTDELEEPTEPDPHHHHHGDHEHDEGEFLDQSGDHALEVHPLHGHAPSAVSPEKDRAVLERLGRLPRPLTDRLDQPEPRP